MAGRKPSARKKIRRTGKSASRQHGGKDPTRPPRGSSPAKTVRVRPAVRTRPQARADTVAPRFGILDFPCDVERLPNGNTLIADAGDEAGGGSEIIEVSPAGEIVWQYAGSLRFAHSAKRLPGGSTLIADTTNNRVIEVDTAGRTLFTSEDWGAGTGRLSDGSRLHYPNKATITPDGTLLITDRNNDRAVRVDRNGRVIWQYAGRIVRPHGGSLTPDGNLLICDSDGQYVREVSPAREVVWSYGDGSRSRLSWPRDADRLDNGNTLITDSKNRRLVEVDRAGRVVWQYDAGYFANFYDADRLGNGNTLISSQQHQEVIEVNPAGKTVWSFRNYTRAFPVTPRVENADFRETDAAGAPRGWLLARRLSEGGGELTRMERRGGGFCPGLVYDRDGALCLQQTRQALPGRTYRLSGTFCTRELDGFACLQLAFLDSKWGLLCDASECPRGTILSGTTPWTDQSLEAKAPEGTAAVDVRLVVVGRGRAFVEKLDCTG
jgi:hypothetical protein